jgi:hypothetical protein
MRERFWEVVGCCEDIEATGRGILVGMERERERGSRTNKTRIYERSGSLPTSAAEV